MARIFAIGDLHLSFSADKPMGVFGEQWENHAERLEENWQRTVAPEDTVLIPGDISWAMHLEDAVPDLEFIGRLNGTKLILKGNHDYWWNSLTKVKNILPESVHAIQNTSFQVGGYCVGGTRLWSLVDADATESGAKIYARELERLKLSLRSMPEGVEKIVMFHYPPVDENNMETAAVRILKEYGVRTVVYAHLHGKAHKAAVTGIHDGIQYIFAAADYLDFLPVQVF